MFHRDARNAPDDSNTALAEFGGRKRYAQIDPDRQAGATVKDASVPSKPHKGESEQSGFPFRYRRFRKNHKTIKQENHKTTICGTGVKACQMSCEASFVSDIAGEAGLGYRHGLMPNTAIVSGDGPVCQACPRCICQERPLFFVLPDIW